MVRQCVFIFVAGLYALPSDPSLSRQSLTLAKLHRKVDWVGAMIATAGLAMLSYTLAIVSADIGRQQVFCHMRQRQRDTLYKVSCSEVYSFMRYLIDGAN